MSSVAQTDFRELAKKRLKQALYDLHCTSGYLREMKGEAPNTSVPQFYACNRLILRAERLLEELEEPRK